MWTGLYLIAFTMIFFGAIFGCAVDESEEKVAKFWFKFGAVGFVSLPFITIAYGVNLIINS